jgi:hypothetical protein
MIGVTLRTGEVRLAEDQLQKAKNSHADVGLTSLTRHTSPSPRKVLIRTVSVPSLPPHFGECPLAGPEAHTVIEAWGRRDLGGSDWCNLLEQLPHSRRRSIAKEGRCESGKRNISVMSVARFHFGQQQVPMIGSELFRTSVLASAERLGQGRKSHRSLLAESNRTMLSGCLDNWECFSVQDNTNSQCRSQRW